MSHLDDSMAQYLEPSLGESDETDITPPRTPEIRLDTDNDLMSDQVLLDHDMQNENTDTENSPPTSQPCPRYTNQQNMKSPQKKQSYNAPQKKELRKRDLKRKFTDQKTVKAKIAKTELSIEKLEKHITCGTCPKSLQYSAKPNVAADILFEKELRDIKLKAEQSLIIALTRFHKRKLQIQEKKLKANVAFAARKQKPVTRNPLKETHSANNIVHNDVNIADLQKQISDLKEIVCTHVLKNKKEECYNSLFSDFTNNSHNSTNLYISKNKRRKKRRNSLKNRRQTKERETNEKFLHNLSSHQLTDSQVSLLSRGLKFIPTPAINETRIKQQLLRDFEQFARRMRLLYIFHGQNREPHPFHVKSTWMPQVQHSVALESYLENVKTQLAEIKVTKPKNNLSRNEVKALKELENNPAINLKKADKGTTTVIMNKADKIYEAKVQLDNRKHYERLKAPMVKITQEKVNDLISRLHQGEHIDEMTKKWLLQTPNPPRIPIFYTLTKINLSRLPEASRNAISPACFS